MTYFEPVYDLFSDRLTYADPVDVGEWHAQKVDDPLLVTRELTNVTFDLAIPNTVQELQDLVKPNLPFAEAQFQDRVSGKPLNPPPSASLWPYAQRGHEDHLQGGKFSHTYPERFWPRWAGMMPGRIQGDGSHGGIFGIRYPYGDLDDVVAQLVRNPYTRQAYLPVWFPEDTGKTDIRLPCSLGYHFLFRKGKLNITYFIRSVDFVRHFRDDVYMACRLCQWVLGQCQIEIRWPDSMGLFTDFIDAVPGTLTMHMISLHCMEGDLPKMRKELNAATK